MSAPVLSSPYKADDPAAQARAAHNLLLADELRARVAEAAKAGSEKARERHISRCKLLPRERVERLLDPGSPFLEIGQLAAHGLYEGEVPGAGLNGPKSQAGRFLLGAEPVAISHDGTGEARPDRETLVTEHAATWLLRPWRQEQGPDNTQASGTIVAPMPGAISSLDVAAGDRVTKGEKLLTLEAMEMEHALLAPFDGVVKELNVATGAQVQVDTLLLRIERQDC